MSEVEKPNSQGCLIGGLTVLCLFLVFRAFVCNGDSTSSGAPVPTTREEMIKAQFSQWDGSHKALEAWVKANMNDPDSYEHVETSWIDGDPITVILKFRGKNAFGGKVLNVARGQFTVGGEMVGAPTISSI